MCNVANLTRSTPFKEADSAITLILERTPSEIVDDDKNENRNPALTRSIHETQYTLLTRDATRVKQLYKK